MKSLKLKCSPLSVNAAWQGRRYKTDNYEVYEKEVTALIPRELKHSAFDGLVEIVFRFHLKHHKTTDYDNLIKPLQDILCKNGILVDDRHIYRATIEKIPSKENFIEIEIHPFELPN